MVWKTSSSPVNEQDFKPEGMNVKSSVKHHFANLKSKCVNLDLKSKFINLDWKSSVTLVCLWIAYLLCHMAYSSMYPFFPSEVTVMYVM